jgi:D-xylonolactonase
MVSPTVSILSELHCLLGEGLHWDSRRMVLWMVDIHGPHLLKIDPTTGQFERRELPEPVGWVLPVHNSEVLLLGLASGLVTTEFEDVSRSAVWVDKSFPGDVNLRLNDAKVDKFGRIWAGSMSRANDHASVGTFARYSFKSAEWEVIDKGYSVPNGPAINLDGSVLLHSDSLRGLVYRFDLDPDGGDVIGRSIWQRFPPEVGYPDGMTFDADDFVWIAHWGRGQVRRYDLSGRLDMAIDLPTSNVTSITFGGPGLDRLFVSSARDGLEDPDPFAGFLFEIKNHGVRGLPSHAVPAIASWPERLIQTLSG